MPRILLVDDHAVVRRGLRDILAEGYPSARFGEASNGREALELIASEPWDLILLDISMPVLGGFDVLKELRRRHIKTPVLILTVHSGREFKEQALKLGAAGYVTKQRAPTVLKGLVRQLLRCKLRDGDLDRAPNGRG